MKKVKLIYITILMLAISSCKNYKVYNIAGVDTAKIQAAYLDLLAKESKKVNRCDSIFYGIRFKMPAPVFYELCNEMFKKKIFTGSYDYQVVIKLNKPFKRPAQLTFYPTFDKPYITKVLCEFHYINASIYKKDDRSDVLIKELVSAMMGWYKGNQFIAMPSQNPLKGPSYIKIDSNRKITVSENDNGTNVDVVYEDLKPGS